jgi:hypothetical protein
MQLPARRGTRGTGPGAKRRVAGSNAQNKISDRRENVRGQTHNSGINCRPIVQHSSDLLENECANQLKFTSTRVRDSLPPFRHWEWNDGI